MISIAKIFKNGQSQAVRLPKEFRFDNQKEVYIKKSGDIVMLIPKDSKTLWNNFFDNLENFSNDFAIKRDEPKQIREDIF